MKVGIRSVIRCMIGGTIWLLCLWNSVYTASRGTTDIWKTKESLIRRLTAEWHKTGVLQRELETQYDILATMRDIELYPVELTGLDDKKVVPFDRALELLQKNNRDIGDKIDEFIPQTVDALQIVKEMVVGEPVESMFEALEHGNLRRISEMFQVKHAIDTLWIRTDSLLTSVMHGQGLVVEKNNAVGPIEDEFFDLLKANLGMQSERYLNSLALIKNEYVKHATPEQKDKMVRIDRERIMIYLKEQRYGLAERKVDALLKCYSNNIVVNDLLLIQAKIKLMRRQYREVLKLLPDITSTIENKRLIVLYELQSLYALEEYGKILADTVSGDIYELTGGDLNLAVWLTIESGLALKSLDAGRPFIRLIERGSPFALHAMHAVARSFLLSGDDTTALSVLQEAEQIKPLTDNDRIASTEIRNAIAALFFDRGEYQKAEKLFYQLLNVPGMFERALSGIAWCYLKTGTYTKAETALRKLINQSPESAVGVEGIVTLARQYLNKARLAWDKHDYIEKERDRLELYLKRINDLAKIDTARSKTQAITTARDRLYALLHRIDDEKVADRETIMAYYTNIDRLCSFITAHYFTGTFQETFFSRSREHMLVIIDSTLEIIGKDAQVSQVSIVSNARIERARIKAAVDNAMLLSVLGLVDKYRWEKEYIEWRKKQVNRTRTVTETDTVNPDTGKVVTTQNRRNTIDSLLVYENEMNQYYTARLKLDIERLLPGKLDSANQCYLYYQLGELYYQEENRIYLTQYERYEQLIAGDDDTARMVDSTVKKARQPPELNHEKSMQFFRAAIDKDSLSVFAGAAFYSLAWCFNDAGQLDSAYYYMDMLARTYPNNPHTPQAWMFCGEYYFDKGNLGKALESFLWVMKYPESEWFDEALYKVAWTQYRMSNPEKAISSFLALVDLGHGIMGKSILEKESMDYIAISFSEIDASGEKGLERAVTFAKKLGDKTRSCQILHRLAQVYKEQGRYEMAQKTFHVLLSTYPDYEKNPYVEAELLTVQERSLPTEVAIEQKYGYFKKYNRKSNWAKKQIDSIRTAADSISAKMLYDAAVSYHQQALQGAGEADYRKAIDAYTDYIDLYQNLPLANECHYNLAEIYFSLGNYHAAVDDFIAVSQRYPGSKYKETAAWNAIVAAQNIVKAELAGKEQGQQ